MISKTAHSVLSEKAQISAHPGFFGESLCFEEDCSYAVAFYEHPEWARFLDADSLATWKRDYRPIEDCLKGTTDYRMAEYALESIPKLEARLARTDEDIREEMRLIVERWNPEYFGMPNLCWDCNAEMGVGVGNGCCHSCRNKVRT